MDWEDQHGLEGGHDQRHYDHLYQLFLEVIEAANVEQAAAAVFAVLVRRFNIGDQQLIHPVAEDHQGDADQVKVDSAHQLAQLQGDCVTAVA